MDFINNNAYRQIRVIHFFGFIVFFFLEKINQSKYSDICVLSNSSDFNDISIKASSMSVSKIRSFSLKEINLLDVVVLSVSAFIVASIKLLSS